MSFPRELALDLFAFFTHLKMSTEIVGATLRQICANNKIAPHAEDNEDFLSCSRGREKIEKS